MKVKTIKRFKDKHTKKIHEAGEVFDVNEERLEEIRKVSEELVEIFNEEAPVENADEPVEKPKRGKAAPKKAAEAE